MISLNTQAISKARDSRSDFLSVIDVWKTIQGEGPYSGERSIFVRLSGCNLQCPWCDTDYTTGASLYTVSDLADRIYDMYTENNDGHYLIVFTGGEPLLQNIWRVVDKFKGRDWGGSETPWVQIETNGTYLPDDFEYWWDKRSLREKVVLVCSPKTVRIPQRMEQVVTYWKYIVDHRYICKNDGLPTNVLGNDLRPYRASMGPDGRHLIFVQPAETGDPVIDKLNVEAAVESCMKYGYRLSLQLHKIIGVK